MNKKILFVSLLVPALLLTLVTGPDRYAKAEDSNTSVKKESSPKPSNSANLDRKAELTTNAIDRLKTKAGKEIDRRLESLTKLADRLKKMKRLSPGTITTLTTSIDTEKTSLNSLKTEIAGITDLTTLREKVKSIVSEYRIFALYMPKVHLLATADALSDAAVKLTEFSTRLQTSINAAKAGGTNTSTMTSDLTAMESAITEAKSQINQVIALVTPLAPDGYPDNKSSLKSARELLRKARASLQTARQSAGKIIDALKGTAGEFKPSPKPAESLAPSPSPSI